MSEWLKDFLSTVPDALFSPATEWHQDEIIRDITLQRNEHAHQERMKQMELESRERIANKLLAAEYMKTLQIAMDTGNMDREVGERLQAMPRLLE